jgi:hypothetical protein
MRLFASDHHPARERAEEAIEYTTATARPVVQALDTVARGATDRSAALAHRGAAMIESVAQTARARPVTAIAICVALLAIGAGLVSYFAYRGRHG